MWLCMILKHREHSAWWSDLIVLLDLSIIKFELRFGTNFPYNLASIDSLGGRSAYISFPDPIPCCESPRISSYCFVRLQQVVVFTYYVLILLWYVKITKSICKFWTFATLVCFAFLFLVKVYKILQYIDQYCQENQLPPLPVILCG